MLKQATVTRKRKLITYLLCLLAAVVVWVAVMAVSPPQTSVKYGDIPVTVYIDDDTARADYAVVSYTQSVSARLRATRVRHLEAGDTVYAYARLSAAECREGEVTVTVSFKDAHGNTFPSDKPVTVTVTLEARGK